MSVAFRVESGDDGKAVAALLPQIIGNIQTAIGCGTVRRANGIAVQVTVGDPVCQGDVIETMADGRIGIRFIDGTVFNLSPGTRLALDDFVCDANGTSHSPLLGVTRGTFAFMAGRVAKTGCLTVDTPVGSIRGRAHSGGFGMLSLTALTFSTMSEVRAADPDVTILDNDSIAYRDLGQSGVLELTTKEPIPKYIVVGDPGETVVLGPRGSTISVIRVPNSPARMEELQAAQQDVLANFAKGLGPPGSSTPPSLNSLPVQPINFSIQSNTTTEQGSLPPLPPPPPPVPEITLIRPPPPPPAPPTLTAATGPIEIDTVVFDTFTATTGTFAASSPRGDALVYGISGGTTGNTVLDGVTYDVSRAGPYGTLYVNSTTGAYTFVPDAGAINALTTTALTSFTVTVSDGTLSASQTFTVTINGVNDAAIISGTATGAVIEAGGALPGTPAVSGTLTDTDVDNPPNTFTPVGSTVSDAGYGTFTMTAAGVWTYTLDNANTTVQALGVNGTLIDTFTVTTVDGTTKLVTITITGNNDTAVISGTATGSVVEAGGALPGTPTVSGTLTDTDVDNPPNTFTAVGPTVSDAGYGTFTMTATGVWTYTLDNANTTVQALGVNGKLTDTFTVTTVDGTTKLVTITITGNNDTAVISGTATGSVVEAGGALPGTPTVSGTLTDTDVDNPPNTFTAVGPTVSDAGYGTFTMTATGVWTYTLDNANTTVQALGVNGKLTDTFTVTTVDGTTKLVTITITGNNDTAIISGTTTGAVTEAGGVANATPGTPTATGILTNVDVDNPLNAFTAVGSTASDAGYGTFTMTAAGVWTYTLDNANSAVQALNVGGTLTDTFTVTSIDGTATLVTITITGTNDAAIISGTTTGSVTEAGGVTPGIPTTTGTLTDTDVDNPPNTFTPVGPTMSDAGYGSFTMTAAGVWTYTLDNANTTVQALGVNGILTDTFTVTTVDGTTKLVTITITGNNDTAIISGTTTGAVIEAGGVANATPGTPTATGILTNTDVDNPLNTFTAVGATASNAGYGTFTMTAAGVWTYTLDNTNGAVQALNAGGTLTDTFTVTTIDGTATLVTISITGNNDTAIISGISTGSVVEAGGALPGTPTVSGTLTDTDVDNPPNTFTAVGPTVSDAGYGTFTMTATGVWTYTLDNANTTVQALGVNGKLTDTFTVTTVDGTTKLVTITITGNNDTAVISGTATGSVVEAGGALPGTPTVSGTLTDTDVDNPPNTFTAVGPTVSDAGYGTFTMTATGVWTYTLDNANTTVQALGVNGKLTDTFTVTTVDGTTKLVTITITGNNDTAIISGATTGSVTEAGGVANAAPGTPTVSGTLTDTDVDNPPNTFVAINSPTATAGGYGTFTMTAAGVWAYTLDNTNSAVQALNVGGTLTDTFTVTTIDGTATLVTITITGTNDAAIISGTTTGSVTEAGGVTPGIPTTTGTLTDTDVDSPPNTFVAINSPTATAGGYGTFTMTAAGVWAYALDNDNSVVQALGAGETLTDTFTVTTVDGTAKVVTITINGASDPDPNDFDNLAPGPEVITDPPFVFGTPDGESFAGGGNDSQIVYAGAGDDTVNGTGKGDILYAGSGNDTVKGNGGDDTIYGGSGSDTVNGNNDNDTIIGGFGADHLTGSNGDDRFVYLSVADSNASLFDIITDFASGSDKIDLTALGALNFLALTSTSTSVPPHTIAWIYDSATNQTIVYVNPTDQTLSIGSSSLLEIHLQGVMTVESSDFVFVAAAAPAAAVAGAAINPELVAAGEADATILAMTTADATADDVGATVQATDLGFDFDADRRWFDFSRQIFSSFDESRMQPVEETDDKAVVMLENEQVIVPHHVHSTELADIDPTPELHSANAATADDGAMTHPNGSAHHASITAPNAPGDIAALQPSSQGHAIDSTPGLHSANAATPHDGAKTHPNGSAHNASITAPNAPGDIAELQPSAQGHAIDQTPGLHSANATPHDGAKTQPNGSAHNASITAPNAPGDIAALQPSSQGHAINSTPGLHSAHAATPHDEAKTHPNGSAHNASITAPNAPGDIAELQPSAQGHAVDQTPGLHSANAVTPHDEAKTHPNGSAHNASITAPNAPGDSAELQPSAQGQAIDPTPGLHSANAATPHDEVKTHPNGSAHDASISAPNAPADFAELQVSAQGHSASPPGNAATKTNLTVTPDSLVSLGPSSPDGNPSIPGTASEPRPDAAGGAHASSPTVPENFGLGAADAAKQVDSFHFKPGVAGSGNSDAFDLADVGHTPASNGNGGAEEAQAISPSPVDHAADYAPAHAANAHLAHASHHDLMV